MTPTFILASARLAAAIARLSLGPLLPILSTDLGLTANSKPALLSAYSTGYIATQVLGGFLADRYGARFVVTGGAAASSVVVLLLAASSDGRRWTALYFILGLISGPLFPACSVVLASDVPPGGRAGAAAIIDAAAAAGTCLATLAPSAAMILGWRGVMVLTASLLAVVAVGGRRSLKSDDKPVLGPSREIIHSSEKKHGRNSEKQRVYGVLYSAPALSLYLCHSCDNFCKYMLNAWLATMFVEKFRVTPSVVGSWLAIQEVVGVVSRVVIGLRDPCHRYRWVASGSAFVLQAAFLFLAFRSPSTSPGSCAVFLTCSAFAASGHSVGFRPRYFEMAPEHTGALSGYGNMIASVASVLGPVVIGTLLNEESSLQFVGGDDTEKWGVVGWLMASVSLLGAFASMGL